jgi:Leucine Rich repeat
VHVEARTDLESGVQFEYQGLRIIAQVLKHNQTITTLYLNNTNIGVQGLRIIAEALNHNQSITRLYLDNTNIGDEGCRAICKNILRRKDAQGQSILTALSLCSNNIGSQGIHALFHALTVTVTATATATDSNTDVAAALNDTDTTSKYLQLIEHKSQSLTYLNLSFNPLGEQGFLTIAHVLTHNQSILTTLCLTSCGMTRIGFEAIGEALVYNRSITCISLGANMMNTYATVASEVFERIFLFNESITTIDMSSNYLCANTSGLPNLTHHHRCDDMIDILCNALNKNQCITEIHLDNNEMTRRDDEETQCKIHHVLKPENLLERKRQHALFKSQRVARPSRKVCSPASTPLAVTVPGPSYGNTSNTTTFQDNTYDGYNTSSCTATTPGMFLFG